MVKALLLAAALAVPSIAHAEKPVAGDYRNSVKWQEYQSRKAVRKAEARQKASELRLSKDHSRVRLSAPVNVSPAIPFGHLYTIPSPVIYYPCWRHRPVVIFN